MLAEGVMPPIAFKLPFVLLGANRSQRCTSPNHLACLTVTELELRLLNVVCEDRMDSPPCYQPRADPTASSYSGNSSCSFTPMLSNPSLEGPAAEVPLALEV